MKKSVGIILAIFGFTLLSVTGCQEAGNDQTGRIVLKVTDAPFPIDMVEKANVTITKVEVRSEDESEGSPFITLFEGSKEIKLMELRNGVMEELADLEIPSGNYNLIRIYVEDASIAVKDYETYTVKVPSGSQTGIKVFIKPSLRVAGDLTAEVLLDFSLEKSFVLQGNLSTPAGIKGFNFKPVIRAVNNTIAGTLQGVVTDADSAPLMGVSVSIAQEEVITTATTDEQGFYAMPGIPAGLYTISAELEGYTPVTVEELEVVEGNLNVQDFVLEVEPPATE